MGTVKPPPIARDHGPIVLAFLFATAAMLVRLMSDGIPDTGDGIAHYQHARYAWQHPEVLLSAWAKPVFTLLASPFAQLGIWGVALFTSLCAALTACVIAGFIGRSSTIWKWAVPVFLFFAPQYGFTIMAGLTEPLFGLLAVVAVVFMLQERWSLALGIASFLPYTRPEHIALIPFMLAITLLNKQWRSLPWVALGSVVYAIPSVIVFHDPLQVLLSDPYTGVDIYGHGEASHFVDHMDEVIGVPLQWATVVAVILWPLLWWKDRERRGLHLRVLLLGLFPALAILALHSYAWWKGGHGSLGLLRVLATGIPLLVLFIVHVLAGVWALFARASKRWSIGASALFVAYGAFAYTDFRVRLEVPFTQDPVRRTVEEAAEVIKKRMTAETRLYYLDPYLAACCNVDPWDTVHARPLFGLKWLADGFGIHTGDLIAWDAHFCPNEGQVPLDSLMRSDRFARIGTFAPAERPVGLGGFVYEIDLFRYSPAERFLVIDTLVFLGRSVSNARLERWDTLPAEGTQAMVRLARNEFPLSFRTIWSGKDSTTLYEDIIVRGEAMNVTKEKDKLLFVLAENEGAQQISYRTSDLSAGTFELRVRVSSGSALYTNKLYVWNRTGQPVDLKRLEVLHERLVQRLK